MYIYNVTINIDTTIHEKWLVWIPTQIQAILKTGTFISAKLSEVLVEEEMGGVTYSIQFTAKTKQDIENYYKKYAPKLRAVSAGKFGSKVLAFRTELRVVQQFFSDN